MTAGLPEAAGVPLDGACREPQAQRPSGWHADLDLAFDRRGGTFAGTVMTRNRHRGPLQVQKPLYPEGAQTCHVVVLHPPGGIAATDRLCLRASLGAASQVLLTTPGATKWYRSESVGASARTLPGVAHYARAHQELHYSVGVGAVLEWLPRENILFDGSQVSTTLDVALTANSTYVGWDILSFGRRASGERWQRGSLRMRTAIRLDDRLLWSERGNLEATSDFSRSSVGLSGHTVCGTFVLAGHDVGNELLGECRRLRLRSSASRSGITRVPWVLIARYLGDSTEEVFGWFSALWGVLRPPLTGRAACAPRVWAC
jgi:urease accessory protein